ncbi:fatty acid desaturase [Oceanicella sp. SM1341]|uniref:fatty acid desaturase n=1 Tax=Oceanicella sp. SM1341 TaxID=1548889 RepID=UPI000E4DA87F|nr:fatty acid desaturase [Oceanicella sp. SM1341]
MQEAFGRRDLIEPAKLKELAQRDDARGWFQLGSHLGAIAATGTALWFAWGNAWAAVPLFMVHGILINFLYAGQHELSHSTVFSSRRLNEVVGRIFGFILLYPRDFDQIQHFAHHRYTQDWEKDGELARPPYTFTSYALWVLGPTYWYSRVRRILRFSAGIVTEPYILPNERPKVIREARLHLAGYALIAALSVWAGSWIAVQLWLAPMVVMKFVHQLQNTIEHLGLPHNDVITQNTRSTRTNALMRWACWNMQYHTAHHAFPSVPCYNLSKLHRTIFTDHGRKPPQMTYLGFQAAVLRAFGRGRTEADYPQDRIWISDDTDLEPVAPPPARA